MATHTEMPVTLKMYGCHVCPWKSTELCEHGIKEGESHSNKVCVNRLKYLNGEMERIGSLPRMIQNEEIIKLKAVTDGMYMEYLTKGDLHNQFATLNKNLSGWIDKARKQDEGLKLQVEGTIAHEELRSMIDIEAKKIEERDKSVRPAEFTEEVQDSRK